MVTRVTRKRNGDKMGKRFELSEFEAVAKNTSIRTSPQKLNLVAEMIRNRPASQALAVLKTCRRRVAAEVIKVLKSAISNAEHNLSLDVANLYVKEASVGKALVMKRFMARARGRPGPLIKPFSNIRIIVEERY